MNQMNMISRTTLLITIGIAVGAGVVGGWLGSAWYSHRADKLMREANYAESTLPLGGSRLAPAAPPAEGTLDFAYAAQVGTESVVFIKTLSNAEQRTDDFWNIWDFFGNRGPISSAGSGVIVSAEGYVMTNHHVVDKADKIEVILKDKHSYAAKVIGTDPNTDLALLKIEASSLKPVQLANSEGVRIGDWVLAVGNPFNLTYTVTAGIVSAKGRNINIVNSQFPIESFIQTDAAINPGNSGGALLNVQGQLVGINTAIASRTGAYNGYGFAIPSNIVRKVYKDLVEFGEVQRAFGGAEVEDIDARLAEKVGPEKVGGDYSGVYVTVVEDEGAAQKAGLKMGDVVLQVQDVVVNSKAEFLEHLALYRPADKVKLKVRRGKQTLDVILTLTNSDGALAAVKRETFTSESLGADIAPLSKVERSKYGVQQGFRLTKIKRGRVAQLGLPEGFVILSVNNYVPENPKELAKLLEQQKGRVVIDGVSPDGTRQYLQYMSY